MGWNGLAARAGLQKASLSQHHRKTKRFPHGGWGKQSHPSIQRASHGLSVPAAAARENGHKVLAGCGCYSWGGKYMSDLITHTQDLGRSVGGGGRGRDGGKPRSIPSVVVVVGVGRILREPITVLKGELPPGRLRGGGVCCQCVSPTPPSNALARSLAGRGREEASGCNARA